MKKLRIFKKHNGIKIPIFHETLNISHDTKVEHVCINEYKELMFQLNRKKNSQVTKTEMEKNSINTEVKCLKLNLNEIDNKKEHTKLCQLKENSNELNYLNMIINNQYSEEIYDQLTDVSLHELYMNSNSTIEKQKKVTLYIEELFNSKILSNEEFELNKIKTIKKITNMMIEPGTKGAIRGNKFNKIVKDKILSLKDKYSKIIDVTFETLIKNEDSKERPDFVIFNKINNKFIIGMNQVDLWNGGQQINRASNYLDNSKNNENKKFLCVIANKYECKNIKSKSFKLMKFGFENDRICYVNNIEKIMLKFFQM